MAIRIGLFNQKGGVGKSCISVNLAAWLTHHGGRVLLLDIDPQQNTSNKGWAKLRDAQKNPPPPFSLLGKPSETLHKQIAEIEQGYDYVVFDSAANISKVNTSGMVASDLAIVPVTPNMGDVMSTIDTLEELSRSQPATRDGTRKNLILLNRSVKREALTRDIYGVITDFEEQYGVPRMSSTMEERLAWAESFSVGKTMYEHKSRARKDALANMDTVFAEMMGAIA